MLLHNRDVVGARHDCVALLHALAEDLRDLAFRNACEISHTRWKSDVDDLVRRLGLVLSAYVLLVVPLLALLARWLARRALRQTID